MRSWAKCDQVTTVPKTLFSERPIGRLGPERIKQIEEAVRLALDFA
jgi:mRNA-degrading endonuclease toxin of MazEF toxin-antitoxin module